MDYQRFIADITEHLTGGPQTPWKNVARADLPQFFGIDGLRAVARSMQLDLMPRNTKEERQIYDKVRKQPVFGTKAIEFDAYFPHMFFDKKVATKLMQEASRKIYETPESEMSKDEKLIELKKIQYRHRSLEGDWNFKDMEETEMFEELTDMLSKGQKISEGRIKWFNSNERAGSMNARTSYTAGWSVDGSSVEAYLRSLNNTYHRQLSQMFGRDIIDRMGKEMPKKWGKEQTKAWQKWAQLYVNDAIGNPTIISEELYNNPTMKLKMSPYGWWADNRIRDKVNGIGKMLGLGRKTKDLPENLRGITINDVRNWSNLEAQYEMAALLAHPKSMSMNMLGGTTHTIQNVGLKNFIKGKSMKYLSKINPEWTNKEAINKFVLSHGVIPEFLLYEMGLQGEFQTKEGKSFIRDAKSALRRNPELDGDGLIAISKKHGKDVWKKAVNFAGKFMSIPERALRRDSFMAHYIHAWEKFGGAVKDYDHPVLIEMAKKGVKATQFLYNAPNRPAFARTSLGKVMSRFQLYAWNSVAFRNQVKRQARISGWAPGSEAVERYRRTLAADMFMFSMANVFAYSLFETNLPQPWGWAQDTADWLFGDEKERDRAFYGAWPTKLAPFQAITPPGLRLAGPTFDAILNDDWSSMAEYHVWNMMPFGRMGRDIFGKGNLRENPMRIPEKLIGFPMREIQSKIKKAKEEEEREAERLLQEQIRVKTW